MKFVQLLGVSSNPGRFSVYPADDKGTFFLHVEKIEHHTPESLNHRNREFYELANQFQLESYDGMDIGPAK
ncbi:MAG: ribonuclease E inhibitor RraB [Burkholderiaceae bacterium]|nr:ribonuclease E inhibitor RraB [Rhodoferax sp.]